MWFEGWNPVLRTVLVGASAYVALVLLLRVTGKRTLSKFNAFDFVVTVALGSTLASILTSRDVAFAQGVAAFAVLLGLQLLVSVLTTRWPPLRRLVTSEPRLLAYRGRLLAGAMRAERVDDAEVLAAVRASGASSLAEVEAVVLETDGSVSVTTGGQAGEDDALRPVGGFPPTQRVGARDEDERGRLRR